MELTQPVSGSPSFDVRFPVDVCHRDDSDDSTTRSRSPKDETDTLNVRLPRRFITASLADSVDDVGGKRQNVSSVEDSLDERERQKDIQQALQWIRQEIRSLRREDHSLVRQFQQLRTEMEDMSVNRHRLSQIHDVMAHQQGTVNSATSPTSPSAASAARFSKQIKKMFTRS